MFQAAFLYMVLTECMNQLNKRQILTKKSINIICWFFYLGLLNMVTLSRMYFACHFFHQCLLGAILGYFMARYAVRNTDFMDKLYGFNKTQMLAIGVGIAVLSTSLYFGQKLFNIDPLWSIKIVSVKFFN